MAVRGGPSLGPIGGGVPAAFSAAHRGGMLACSSDGASAALCQGQLAEPWRSPHSGAESTPCLL